MRLIKIRGPLTYISGVALELPCNVVESKLVTTALRVFKIRKINKYPNERQLLFPGA